MKNKGILVSVSGGQGSGKSTILSKIKELGYPVIERKTSRSILKEWNVTLEEVNNDLDLTLKFQQEILSRKFEDEQKEKLLLDMGHVVFTERTYADLFTYFLITLGNNNRYSDEINEYYKQCIAKQQTYDKVFYLKAGHFVPEHDDVRGSNIHYSRMVDLTMLDITQQLTPVQKLLVIQTPCLEQRLHIILAHCGLYENESKEIDWTNKKP